MLHAESSIFFRALALAWLGYRVSGQRILDAGQGAGWGPILGGGDFKRFHSRKATANRANDIELDDLQRFRNTTTDLCRRGGPALASPALGSTESPSK